ncbi:hypothetical protein, partial [Streptomyces bambusae]
LSNTTHGEGVVRGVGYAVGIQNVGFSEGFDEAAENAAELARRYGIDALIPIGGERPLCGRRAGG